jgi:hypothetical protein
LGKVGCCHHPRAEDLGWWLGKRIDYFDRQAALLAQVPQRRALRMYCISPAPYR